MAAFRARRSKRIRAQVKGGRVVCGLSAASIPRSAALLLHEAIGDALTCIFVDTACCGSAKRAGRAPVPRHYNIPLDPSRRQRPVPEKARRNHRSRTEAQGASAPTSSTSSTEAHRTRQSNSSRRGRSTPTSSNSVSATGGPRVRSKSHHNVGGLPDRMKLALIEPLARAVKDEVRALGRELAARGFCRPPPVPGPGLAIRIPGEVTRDKLDILRKADAVFLEEIRNAGSTSRSGAFRGIVAGF